MTGSDEKQPLILAACGLDCTECDILQAANNVKLAIDLADMFIGKSLGDVEVGKMRCGGCKGDRSIHWGADCWILKCCVDGKGLDNCGYCETFPCEGLVEWASLSERYTRALGRLKQIHSQMNR